MAIDLQDVAAIAVVLAAGLYLTRRIFGIPRRARQRGAGTNVVIGARLARGIGKARTAAKARAVDDGRLGMAP